MVAGVIEWQDPAGDFRQRVRLDQRKRYRVGESETVGKRRNESPA